MGSLGVMACFGLGTFSLRFRSFSSGSGRKLLPFRMRVFCGYVFVCIRKEADLKHNLIESFKDDSFLVCWTRIL